MRSRAHTGKRLRSPPLDTDPACPPDSHPRSRRLAHHLEGAFLQPPSSAQGSDPAHALRRGDGLSAGGRTGRPAPGGSAHHAGRAGRALRLRRGHPPGLPRRQLHGSRDGARRPGRAALLHRQIRGHCGPICHPGFTGGFRGLQAADHPRAAAQDPGELERGGGFLRALHGVALCQGPHGVAQRGQGAGLPAPAHGGGMGICGARRRGGQRQRVHPPALPHAGPALGLCLVRQPGFLRLQAPGRRAC